MPIYTFQHKETQEIVEIVQSMNETHVYMGNKGDEPDMWERIFSIPYAQSNSKINPFSASQFSEKIKNTKGTVADVLERSAELSEKRAEITGGVDPVKRQYFDDYKKKTGQSHLEDAPKTFENKNVKVDFTRPSKRKRKS